MSVLALFAAIVTVVVITFMVEFFTFKNWAIAAEVSYFATFTAAAMYVFLNLSDMSVVKCALLLGVPLVASNFIFQALEWPQSKWGDAFVRSGGTILGVFSAVCFAAAL